MPTDLDLAPRPFDQFEAFARTFVAFDVELGDDPRHRLVGYVGQDPLCAVDLRPFPPGGIEAPMVEALALVLALGADRFATALPGRAWSMEDPIPPVTDAGDLRQRVLVLTTADGVTDPRTWLLPFDVEHRAVRWGEPPAGTEDGDGWVPHALAVAAAADWAPDPGAASQQLQRCVGLGHHVLLAPAGAAVLDDA